MFHFKHFSLHHENSSLKVGTDAVLLGAWADVAGARRILDIGTGCGVLALIAAQRNAQAQVDAVDIDEASVVEAAANFTASPWCARLRAHRMDVRRMHAAEPYDAIICNPPYYGAEMVSSDVRKRVARHAATLAPGELFRATARLLGRSGRAMLIVPADRERTFLESASEAGLRPVRRAAVHYMATRPPKRILLELAFTAEVVASEGSIIVRDRPEEFTSQYRELMNDLLVSL